MSERSIRRVVATTLSLASLLGATLLGTGTAQAEDTTPAVTADTPSVHITLAPGHATLTTRRTWHNAGGITTLRDSFRIPRGGVLNGLRVKRRRGGWARAQMLPSHEARDRFFGEGPQGGEAMLLTGSGSHFAYKMHPFLSQATASAEHTVVIATRYVDGRHVLDNPGALHGGLGSPDTPKVVRVVGRRGRVSMDGVTIGKNTLLTGTQFELVPHASPVLSGALAEVKLDGKRRALRYRLHVGERVSKTPSKAYVVVVLDASRSLHPSQAAGMVAAARAYVKQLPDAKVDIITFARHATSVYGRFMSAPHAEGMLTSMTLHRENGSDLGAALALAKSRLATAPKRALKRLVVFTDGRLAAGTAADSLGLDDGGALTHVAIVGDGHDTFSRRDDKHAFAPRVAKTGGVVWQLEAHNHALMSDLTAATAQLVRPTRLHGVALTSKAAPHFSRRLSEILVEGDGATDDLIVETSAPAAVTVSGRLWQQPVSVTLRPSATETRLWEGLILANGAGLTPEEKKRLALRSRVVTADTSYVSASAGSRSLAPRGERIHLGGISGRSRCGGVGIRRGGLGPRDTKALFRALDGAYTTCLGGGRSVSVEVELTRSEIVRVAAKSDNPALARCMQEQAWKVALPDAFNRRTDSAVRTFAWPLPPGE